MYRRLYGNEIPQVRNYVKRSEDRKIGSDFEKKKDRIGKSDRLFFRDRPITTYRDIEKKNVLLWQVVNPEKANKF